MRSSTVLIIVLLLAALAVLLGLGTWQMQRLAWKENLIEMTRERSAGEPLGLPDVLAVWEKEGDVAYVPVKLTGTFNHKLESFYFNTYEGTSGWNVYTPLILSDGTIAVVNRGFTPDAMRDASKRTESMVEGEVEIIGLARNPILEKPNSLIPDNQLKKREFYWKDFSDMAKLARGESQSPVIPFFIDAGKSEAYNGYPLGGTTRMSFPNNHLQYALTWYGLALALIGVGGVFLFSSHKRNT